MKNLDYVIVGSNMNETYLDFWPIVSKVWKEIIGITPILGLICDEDSELEESECGYVKKFKKIPNLDTGLQSQIVRLFLAKFLNGYCLISDIDMIPLSKKYFFDNSSYCNNENIVLYSADNLETSRNKQYPMCYVLSHSETYKKIFDLNLSWEQFCLLLNSRNEGWYTDQRYLFDKINSFENVVKLNRGWKYGPADNRIDRINWIYDIEKVKKGSYIDCHSLRPYKQYKEKINNLVDLLFI